MIAIKTGTHYVLKKTDVRKYLEDQELEQLATILNAIEERRAADGKKQNEYYICNTDEPYADNVLAQILIGEEYKEEKNGDSGEDTVNYNIERDSLL